MKKYMNNILIYIAALFGIVAFIGLFASPLQSFNSAKGTWSAYNLRVYLGETLKNTSGETKVVYKGTIAPIFGYIFPLAMAIVLIIESFRPAWNAKLAVINTILALLFFTSAVLVLLTKELFLQANEWGNGLVIIDGETVFAIRNGGGPVSSAICSAIAGIILLVVTWMPRKRKEIDFIEK